MEKYVKNQNYSSTGSAETWENEGGSVPLQIMRLTVDETLHNNDGLVLHGWDGQTPIRAFIGRHVMDDWLDPVRSAGSLRSLYREEYNALGKQNLLAIERIVARKYSRGRAFNRQHPFVDVLLADITESGEVLDVSQMHNPPPYPEPEPASLSRYRQRSSR
jgi:hypothetical protein